MVPLQANPIPSKLASQLIGYQNTELVLIYLSHFNVIFPTRLVLTTPPSNNMDETSVSVEDFLPYLNAAS